MNVTESDDLFVVLNADKSEVLNRTPVAYLVCNQSPPGADGTPSLMTFRDVETLFHEVSKLLKGSDCFLISLNFQYLLYLSSLYHLRVNIGIIEPSISLFCWRCGITKIDCHNFF